MKDIDKLILVVAMIVMASSVSALTIGDGSVQGVNIEPSIISSGNVTNNFINNTYINQTGNGTFNQTLTDSLYYPYTTNPFSYINTTINPFNQVLNTSSSVSFYQLNLTNGTIVNPFIISATYNTNPGSAGTGGTTGFMTLYPIPNWTTSLGQNVYGMFNTLQDQRTITAGSSDTVVDFNAQWNGLTTTKASTSTEKTAYFLSIDANKYNRTSGIIGQQIINQIGINHVTQSFPTFDDLTKSFIYNMSGIVQDLQNSNPVYLSGVSNGFNYKGVASLVSQSGYLGGALNNTATLGYGFYTNINSGAFNSTFAYYSSDNATNYFGTGRTDINILNVTNSIYSSGIIGINYNETIQNTTLTTCNHRFVNGVLVFSDCMKT